MEIELVRLILQVGLVLLVAKLGGEIFGRYLKQPVVLGELMGGMLIGPYALGGIVPLPYLGHLFTESGAGGMPISTGLHALSQIGVIILLFTTGLEADLRGLVKYGSRSLLIALGGVVVPFVLGDITAVLFGLAEGISAPPALFMGAIMTATSAGITTRVLRDMGKLRTPEGVTILGSAIIDDVLGVLVLTIVANLARQGSFKPFGVLFTIGEALVFWFALTGLSILLSQYISRVLKSFRSSGAITALGLALVFIAAAVAELFGLAAIIGAFSIGLGLSNSEIARPLRERLEPIYDLFVPIFFAVMGMMLDFHAVGGLLLFGLIVVVFAILAKLLGCGLPSLGLGFNKVGAARIGFGMSPRGEVALVIAGIALAGGVINSDMFGIAVTMVFITALVTPPILLFTFRHGGAGWKGGVTQDGGGARDDEHQ